MAVEVGAVSAVTDLWVTVQPLDNGRLVLSATNTGGGSQRQGLAGLTR